MYFFRIFSCVQWQSKVKYDYLIITRTWNPLYFSQMYYSIYIHYVIFKKNSRYYYILAQIPLFFFFFFLTFLILTKNKGSTRKQHRYQFHISKFPSSEHHGNYIRKTKIPKIISKIVSKLDENVLQLPSQLEIWPNYK